MEVLLAFIPRSNGNRRHSDDYISLIHVPAQGSERVYSLSFCEPQSLLTVANYKETVWEVLGRNELDEDVALPELDALQATIPNDHPVFEVLDGETLSNCENSSDGVVGMDYYLMLWQKDGQANVVECWEPYGRNDAAWLRVIGALQVLSSQFEYAACQG